MARANLFAVPFRPAQRSLSTPSSPRKRKRGPEVKQLAQHDDALDVEQGATPPESQSLEYSAVVTPSERIQRRLAGLPLDQKPPPPPFPHAQALARTEHRKRISDGPVSSSSTSLHAQHLAAMTAVLHRCLRARDYHRASRAIGLILRNEVGGKAIDIRSEGIWGIGAEILLCQTTETIANMSTANGRSAHFSREGLEKAKIYYEGLIVQHPQHRTWPDAINERDFCTALFGLWVYVVSQEASQLHKKSLGVWGDEQDSMLSMDSGLSALDARRWELGQAQTIAEAMDDRMKKVPFVDDVEMIQLRAMTALWVADVMALCSASEEENSSQRSEYERTDEPSSAPNVIHPTDLQPQPSLHRYSGEAQIQRQLAQKLFQKLEGRRDSSE